MHQKTIQLWIIVLISVLSIQLYQVVAKKNREEIIVINNTGGGGCGSGAKTIVKTDGSKKKKGGGHKIILMAGGSGKCGGDKHHHHTKVVHVPYPVPVPVPVKHGHEERGEKNDHWASSSNSHEDQWTSASDHDEIKPHKQVKVSASTVPHRPYSVMMARMEKYPVESKSNLLQTLLNVNDKSSKADKKSSNGKNSTSDSKKKNDQSINDINQMDQPNFDMMPNPMGYGMFPPSPALDMMHAGMNPAAGNFLPPMPLPSELQQQYAQQPTMEQKQQLHDAIHQHIQMQQQFEQHLQNEHQKMQEAIASTVPQQLPQDSPLASQLPIPLPGQSLSAPVFEPIVPINNRTQQLSSSVNGVNSNAQQMPPQYNELEIIPYEIQQQLQAAQMRSFAQSAHESLKDQYSKENNLINGKETNKNKKFELIDKDHSLDASSSNVLNAAIAVLPSNLAHYATQHLIQSANQQPFNQQAQQRFSQADIHPMSLNAQFRHFMMNNRDKLSDYAAQQTIQIPFIIDSESPQPVQEEQMTVKRFKI